MNYMCVSREMGKFEHILMGWRCVELFLVNIAKIFLSPHSLFFSEHKSQNVKSKNLFSKKLIFTQGFFFNLKIKNLIKNIFGPCVHADGAPQCLRWHRPGPVWIWEMPSASAPFAHSPPESSHCAGRTRHKTPPVWVFLINSLKMYSWCVNIKHVKIEILKKFYAVCFVARQPIQNDWIFGGQSLWKKKFLKNN